jgi:hypothetical protein
MFFYYYKQHYMNIIYALKNLNNALVTDDFMCAEDEDYDLVWFNQILPCYALDMGFNSFIL